MKKLVIMGAGGFAAEVAWVAEAMTALHADGGFAIQGLVDDNPAKRGSEMYDYRCLGALEDVAATLGGEEMWYHCAIGDNRARCAAAARCDALGWRAATLIHPSVVQSRHVSVGEGTYVGALSILNPYCVVGRHVIVNQRVAVGHHSAIGDFVNLCPGAQINGACIVGAGSLCGANSSIVQCRRVGEWSVVASNSLVLTDVPAGTHMLGVPAKRFHHGNEGR